MRTPFLWPIAAVSALLLAFAGACSGESPTGGSGGVTSSSTSSSTTQLGPSTIDYGCPICTCTCAGASVETSSTYDDLDCAKVVGTACLPPVDAGTTDGGTYTFESCTVTGGYICG